MRVALVGIGNARWIAGVQYHHSLLFGNSLLPDAERLMLRVYLEESVHSTADYEPVAHLAAGVHSTDFFPKAPHRLYRQLRKVAKIILKQRRIPQFPQSNLPALARAHASDVLFTANGVEADIDIPQVCWIPDFQHINHPEFFSQEELARRDRVLDDVFAKATRIAVSNQCSLEDAMRRYPDARERTVVLPFVMYLGRSWRSGDPHEVVASRGLPRKFLLFPSQFWKHKNHARLFEAVKRLRDGPCPDLVLVSTGYFNDPRSPEYVPSLQAFIRDHHLEEAIRILGLIPRNEQVQLMRAAAAIAQPSLFEGWSALVEECRSMGKIVLISDVPMHREQTFDGMHFFDPLSVDSMVEQIGARWASLSPGPDLEREEAAEWAYLDRTADFARRFQNVCREAREAHHRAIA